MKSNSTPDIDRIVHEPARLKIMMLLSGARGADFTFLLTTFELTRGNLSRHMEKLESAAYVGVTKSFKGKIPNTSCQLTGEGAAALSRYWDDLDALRRLGRS